MDNIKSFIYMQRVAQNSKSLASFEAKFDRNPEAILDNCEHDKFVQSAKV